MKKDVLQPTINVTAKGDTITILQGEAQEQLPLTPRVNQVIMSTDINAPATYWAAKKSLHETIKSHVLFDRIKGIVVLIMGEDKKETCDKITGTLSPNPELTRMNINSDSMVSHKEMLKKLKWARLMFLDREKYDKIVSALTNFKTKIETSIDKSNDKQGNITDSMVISTKQEIPLLFDLTTNLFIGQPAVSFDVQILVDVQGGQLVFGLESMTLYEKQNTTRTEIVDGVVKAIDGVVAIEASL